MRKTLVTLAVLSLTWLGTGCGGSPTATPEYKKKTEPVVAMLDKLKAEGTAANMKPFATDYAATQAAFTQWDQSLTDKEKKLESATNMRVAFMLFTQANMEITRTGKSAPEAVNKASEALDATKRLLADNK